MAIRVLNSLQVVRYLQCPAWCVFVTMQHTAGELPPLLRNNDAIFYVTVTGSRPFFAEIYAYHDARRTDYRGLSIPEKNNTQYSSV